MFKRSTHTPAHLLIDDTPYFITAAIYMKQYLLSSKVIKESLLELMEGYFQKYQWELHHCIRFSARRSWCGNFGPIPHIVLSNCPKPKMITEKKVLWAKN